MMKGGTVAGRHAHRVAFFGGSFDPPHRGHLTVARAAQTALGLDDVLFAPVGAQPLKLQGATASFRDRLAMTRLAIADEPGFEISLADAPTEAGEPNFTLETLERLHADLGSDCTLFFLIGADSFFGLRQWHRAAEIPFAAPLIVASRPGQHLESIAAALPQGLTIEAAAGTDTSRNGVEIRDFLLRNTTGASAKLYLLPGLDIRISASEIREQLRETGQTANIRDLLPDAVAEYVLSHGLYR
jgi:nicotinate-nucleotide adenylyltransferase